MKKSFQKIASTKNEYSLELCKEILEVLELRREQLNSKANILIAVNSALIAGQIQFLFKDNIEKINLLVIFLTVLSFVIAVWSIFETINVIKTLKSSPKTRIKNHIFYFGTLSKMSIEKFEDKIKNITFDELLNEYASQSISLSRNLNIRYDSLGKAYKRFLGSLLVFSTTVITVSVINKWPAKVPITHNQINSAINKPTKNIQSVDVSPRKNILSRLKPDSTKLTPLKKTLK